MGIAVSKVIFVAIISPNSLQKSMSLLIEAATSRYK
jgi:hypothetical protein